MSDHDPINWLVPAVFPPLRPREIHLWCAWLGESGSPEPHDLSALSRDEIARANAFYFSEDRRRFLAARCNLRQVLACYTARDPESLAFSYGRYGKPMLVHRASATGPLDPTLSNLSFNQSHCGALWLLAVAWNQPLGVDVEQVRDLSDLALIEGKLFSGEELLRQRGLPLPDRQREFFRRWTQREASAKFHGLGFDPAATYVPPDQIELLTPTARSVGALAYGGAPVRIQQFCWPAGRTFHPMAATASQPPDVLVSPYRPAVAAPLG